MANRDVESAKATRSLEWRRPGSSSDGIIMKKEKKGGRTVVERMQLFRRAFTSRICDRHLLYPPLYIPGTVLHPSYPPATSFSSYNHHLNPHEPAALSRGQGVSVRNRGRPLKAPREEFFFHIHQGVIVRRNVTNFQPPESTRDTPSVSYIRTRI